MGGAGGGKPNSFQPAGGQTMYGHRGRPLGQVREWKTSLLPTSHWLELSHRANLSTGRLGIMQSRYVPKEQDYSVASYQSNVSGSIGVANDVFSYCESHLTSRASESISGTSRGLWTTL